MRVLLVSADSINPNLALMKLSAYHKLQGDEVEFLDLGLKYYPSRRNKKVFIEEGRWERIYCSVVFEGTFKYIEAPAGTIFGGTGYSLSVKLPPEVEEMHPDYTLYPDNDMSYGYITRGCIRNCYFCKVPRKEGPIHRVAEIEDIVRHKKVNFMDNNILAFPGHMEVLRELVDKQIPCNFDQGFDIRLLNKENSALLSKLKYFARNYIFAFDDIKYMPVMEKQLPLLDWRFDRYPWIIKFYMYIHPDMPLKDTVRRIEWARNNGCLSYIMRDIKCWGSEYDKFYTDLASWANQPGIYRHQTFYDWLPKHNKKPAARVKKHRELYERGRE